jgi:hypothetical protein
LLLSLLNRMPPLFAAAIGFSPSPTAPAHVATVVAQLQLAQPLHLGSLVTSLDAPVTNMFIACVRLLLLCAECHAAPSVFDPAALMGATAAAAEAADVLAAAASASDVACVSTLHSAGLFSLTGTIHFVSHHDFSYSNSALQPHLPCVLLSPPSLPFRTENPNYRSPRAVSRYLMLPAAHVRLPHCVAPGSRHTLLFGSSRVAENDCRQ